MLYRFKKEYICIYVTMQKKNEGGLSSCAHKWVLYIILVFLLLLPFFFPSSVYIYKVHRASKMLYKILHRMMVDIVKTTKRIYLYTTVLKCKKLFFEICTDFFLFFFFYHSTIVRMNEFHVGYAHWFR
jgi:hypothetical protein